MVTLKNVLVTGALPFLKVLICTIWYVQNGTKMYFGAFNLVYHPNDSFIYFFLREDVIKIKKAIIKIIQMMHVLNYKSPL